jgi:hypothetical protein
MRIHTLLALPRNLTDCLFGTEVSLFASDTCGDSVYSFHGNDCAIVPAP